MNKIGIAKILSVLLVFVLLSCGSKPHHYKYKKSKNYKNSSVHQIKNLAKKSDKNLAANSNEVRYSIIDDEDSVAEKSAERYEMPDNEREYSGYYKVGNPYEIQGVAYAPQDYEDYEEVGTASWYGDDFHGKKTANGEVYNMHDMTAAHPTLPLPSLVRVTNLRNGKKVIARVNDRGPFAKDRIIDVSERAADALGFKSQGTTEVKIELLKDDTDDLLKKLKIK